MVCNKNSIGHDFENYIENIFLNELLFNLPVLNMNIDIEFLDNMVKLW